MTRRTYSCGGPGSYDGSCGASDCACCHPEWQGEDDDDGRAEDAEDLRREDERSER
jgi:hypothetical protein